MASHAARQEQPKTNIPIGQLGGARSIIHLLGENEMSVVEIKYFSDVLCVWAYASQARIDAVKETFGDDVQLTQRFCSVFGDTPQKITSTWNDRGGFTQRCG